MSSRASVTRQRLELKKAELKRKLAGKGQKQPPKTTSSQQNGKAAANARTKKDEQQLKADQNAATDKKIITEVAEQVLNETFMGNSNTDESLFRLTAVMEQAGKDIIPKVVSNMQKQFSIQDEDFCLLLTRSIMAKKLAGCPCDWSASRILVLHILRYLETKNINDLPVLVRIPLRNSGVSLARSAILHAYVMHAPARKSNGSLAKDPRAKGSSVTDVWASRTDFCRGQYLFDSLADHHDKVITSAKRALGLGNQSLSPAFTDPLLYKDHFERIPDYLAWLEKEIDKELAALSTTQKVEELVQNNRRSIDITESVKQLFNCFKEAHRKNDGTQLNAIYQLIKLVPGKSKESNKNILQELDHSIPSMWLYFARQPFLFKRDVLECCSALLNADIAADVLSEDPTNSKRSLIKTSVLVMLGQLLTEKSDLKNILTVTLRTLELKQRLNLIQAAAIDAYKKYIATKSSFNKAPEAEAREKEPETKTQALVIRVPVTVQEPEIKAQAALVKVQEREVQTQEPETKAQELPISENATEMALIPVHSSLSTPVTALPSSTLASKDADETPKKTFVDSWDPTVRISGRKNSERLQKLFENNFCMLIFSCMDLHPIKHKDIFHAARIILLQLYPGNPVLFEYQDQPAIAVLFFFGQQSFIPEQLRYWCYLHANKSIKTLPKQEENLLLTKLFDGIGDLGLSNYYAIQCSIEDKGEKLLLLRKLYSKTTLSKEDMGVLMFAGLFGSGDRVLYMHEAVSVVLQKHYPEDKTLVTIEPSLPQISLFFAKQTNFLAELRVMCGVFALAHAKQLQPEEQKLLNSEVVRELKSLNLEESYFKSLLKKYCTASASALFVEFIKISKELKDLTPILSVAENDASKGGGSLGLLLEDAEKTFYSESTALQSKADLKQQMDTPPTPPTPPEQNHSEGVKELTAKPNNPAFVPHFQSTAQIERQKKPGHLITMSGLDFANPFSFW